MITPIFGTLPPKTTAKQPVKITTAQELREALNKGLVKVTFTKTSGEQVTLSATTDLMRVPKEQHPVPNSHAVGIKEIISMPNPQFSGATQKPTDPNHIMFYSPERNGWRSLRFERLIQAFVI